MDGADNFVSTLRSILDETFNYENSLGDCAEKASTFFHNGNIASGDLSDVRITAINSYQVNEDGSDKAHHQKRQMIAYRELASAKPGFPLTDVFFKGLFMALRVFEGLDEDYTKDIQDIVKIFLKVAASDNQHLITLGAMISEKDDYLGRDECSEWFL